MTDANDNFKKAEDRAKKAKDTHSNSRRVILIY